MLSVSIGPIAMSVQRGVLWFAVIVTLLVAAYLTRQRRIPVADAIFSILLWAVIGARMAFAVRYSDDYASPLWSVLDVRDGGFDRVAGALSGLGYAVWRGWRNPMLRRPLFVALSVGFGAWLTVTGLFMVLEKTARGMPPTALVTMSGADTSLATRHDGRPMVVNLWATWCPPCRREMPVLQAAQEAYPDVQFLFVNQREPLWTVQQYLSAESLSLRNIVRDERGELAAYLGAYGLPMTLYYSAEGRLVDSHFGELSQATLRHAVERLRRAASKSDTKISDQSE
ncbi:MAG: TlpA family protein disulfide reductase [Alcanivorax sp.]|nr:TlpA family protein disulfide reductase [Alcanivorax sp.]